MKQSTMSFFLIAVIALGLQQCQRQLNWNSANNRPAKSWRSVLWMVIESLPPQALKSRLSSRFTTIVLTRESTSALTFLYHNPVITRLVIEPPGDLHAAAVYPTVCFLGVHDREGHVALGEVPFQHIPAVVPLCHLPSICPDNGPITFWNRAAVTTPAHRCNVLYPINSVRAGHSDILANPSFHKWSRYCGACGQKDKCWYWAQCMQAHLAWLDTCHLANTTRHGWIRVSTNRCESQQDWWSEG